MAGLLRQGAPLAGEWEAEVLIRTEGSEELATHIITTWAVIALPRV